MPPLSVSTGVLCSIRKTKRRYSGGSIKKIFLSLPFVPDTASSPKISRMGLRTLGLRCMRIDIHTGYFYAVIGCHDGGGEADIAQAHRT
jgi:hypothetical protein